MTERGLTRSERELLQRVSNQGGEAGMLYADTGNTKRLTARGLLRWEQQSAFVATLILTDAGREALTNAQ